MPRREADQLHFYEDNKEVEISTHGRSQRDYDEHIHGKCIDNVVY